MGTGLLLLLALSLEMSSLVVLLWIVILVQSLTNSLQLLRSTAAPRFSSRVSSAQRPLAIRSFSLPAFRFSNGDFAGLPEEEAAESFLSPGQMLYLHDLRTYGVLRRRTKLGSWIIEVYQSQPGDVMMQSVGFIERDEASLTLPLQPNQPSGLPVVAHDMSKIQDLNQMMRWIKNNLGVRALSSVMTVTRPNPVLGLHRYGLAPRGEPVRVAPTSASISDFILSSLGVQKEEILQNDALFNSIITALFRRDRVEEAKELLRAKHRSHLEDQYHSAQDKSNEKVRIREAEAAHRSGDLSLALAGYNSVLQENQKNAESMFLVGVALQDMGRVFESIPYYQKVLEFNPKHANAYRNLGVAYSNLGMKTAAGACFKRALALDTEKMASLCNLAALSWQSKDFDSAFRYVQAALKLDPRDARPNNLMRWFLAQRGGTKLVDEEKKFASTTDVGKRGMTLGQLLNAFGVKVEDSVEDYEENDILDDDSWPRKVSFDQNQEEEDGNYGQETGGKIPSALTREVQSEDHVAEERRPMSEISDMKDWMQALQKSWEAREREQITRRQQAQQAWEDIIDRARVLESASYSSESSLPDSLTAEQSQGSEVRASSAQSLVQEPNRINLETEEVSEGDTVNDAKNILNSFFLSLGMPASNSTRRESTRNEGNKFTANIDYLNNMVNEEHHARELERIDSAYNVLQSLGSMFRGEAVDMDQINETAPVHGGKSTVEQLQKSVEKLSEAQRKVDASESSRQQVLKSSLEKSHEKATGLKQRLKLRMKKLKQQKLNEQQESDATATLPENDLPEEVGTNNVRESLSQLAAEAAQLEEIERER